uniref:Methyltranfer_dom domain-containing protein n=1 Tax=Syphacia muris TaxID=451379 RepID=A0A0N5AUJ8_9BILA
MANATLKLSQIIENTVLGQTIILAGELGIFKALSEYGADGRLVTSEMIAKRYGYKQRYVQEMLSCLACGDILEVNVTGDGFRLNRNMNDYLTAQRSPHILEILKMVIRFPYIFEDMKRVFQKTGPSGISYQRYKNTHLCTGSFTGTKYKNQMISCFLPLTGLSERLKTEGLRVLNVACGSAQQLIELVTAKNFPLSKFVGVDGNLDSIKAAKDYQLKQGVTNIEFLVIAPADLPTGWTRTYDWVTMFESCHNLTRPDRCLNAIRRVLKREGTLTIVDANGMSNPYLDKIWHRTNATIGYGISLFHCLPIGSNAEDAYCLGTMWGQKRACDLLKKCGFEDVKVSPISFADAEILYVCKKTKPEPN